MSTKHGQTRTDTDEQAQHTPGPWRYEDGWIMRQNDESQWVDLTRIDFHFCESKEEKANARLIAAAPELLAACRAVVERWERGDLAEAARMCAAAVQKATETE